MPIDDDTKNVMRVLLYYCETLLVQRIAYQQVIHSGSLRDWKDAYRSAWKDADRRIEPPFLTLDAYLQKGDLAGFLSFAQKTLESLSVDGPSVS